MNELINGKGAIISRSISLDGGVICFAERSEPLEEADSGWYFAGHENEALDSSGAQIWSISEVLECEPTLSVFINMPAGTRLIRSSKNDKWEEMS